MRDHLPSLDGVITTNQPSLVSSSSLLRKDDHGGQARRMRRADPCRAARKVQVVSKGVDGVRLARARAPVCRNARVLKV
eukprot:6210338-Pleurochrysis_carterae.AAC.2